MDGSESIVSMIYIRKYILAVRTYYFINGMSRTKNMEHILERKADFEAFKNGAQLIEKTCNTIKSSISLWKEYLETMMENNQWLCESESDSYHWLSLYGLKSIISINPYENLLSEQLKTNKKSQFLIDNKQHLCEHGFLHTMTALKGKYIPENVYTSMKDTFNLYGVLTTVRSEVRTPYKIVF